MLEVTLLEVSERDEGVVALHLLTGPGLEQVLRYEPTTYQPISQ